MHLRLAFRVVPQRPTTRLAHSSVFRDARLAWDALRQRLRDLTEADQGQILGLAHVDAVQLALVLAIGFPILPTAPAAGALPARRIASLRVVKYKERRALSPQPFKPRRRSHNNLPLSLPPANHQGILLNHRCRSPHLSLPLALAFVNRRPKAPERYTPDDHVLHPLKPFP